MPNPQPDAVSWSCAPRGADVRLVVADMDGTLLNSDGTVPGDFWPVLELMQTRGVVFAPASGRQAATLARLFDRHLPGMPLVAENGSYVVRDGHEISSATIDRAVVVAVVEKVRELVAQGLNIGVVVCGKRSAYIERSDPAFRAECDQYYVQLQNCDDALLAEDDIIKLAIFDFDDAGESISHFTQFRGEHAVVLSGRHWIDIMVAGVNKGVAVSQLQRDMSITSAQTAAFGDFLNDVEMLTVADLSFAMADGHPTVREVAQYVAPTNSQGGVVTVLRHLLDLPPVPAT